MRKVHKLIVKAERIKKNTYGFDIGIISKTGEQWHCLCTRYNCLGNADSISKEKVFKHASEAEQYAYSIIGKEAPVIIIDV